MSKEITYQQIRQRIEESLRQRRQNLSASADISADLEIAIRDFVAGTNSRGHINTIHSILLGYQRDVGLQDQPNTTLFKVLFFLQTAQPRDGEGGNERPESPRVALERLRKKGRRK